MEVILAKKKKKTDCLLLGYYFPLGDFSFFFPFLSEKSPN